MNRPSWRLPTGVSRGTWDYLQSKSIATEYDVCFADHPLLRLDIGFVRKQFEKLLERADRTLAKLVRASVCKRQLGVLPLRSHSSICWMRF